MPTLNKRADDSARLHPRQTEYYITAKPPDVGYITYQIDSRAVEFLTATRGYDDGDQLSWSLVHPLRQIRDLYTLDEGRPRDANPDDSHTDQVTVPSLDTDEIEDLVEYLAQHPDVVGDIETFRTRLKREDGSYAAGLQRDGYTAVETPGFESTGNDTLDRIAQHHFGEETSGAINWNGERIYDYIEVTDRAGTTHRFPKLESRLPEGERLRLSRDIYERWGPQIGESEVISRRYDPGDESFPNRWIGQRENAPEPRLEQAKSPRAFYYRTIGGRSHYAPGTEAEEAFADACDYSLEVYKANFPVAVDPNDLQTEYVTVEEATEPWHDFQVPPGWQETYADNGGLPPLKREPDSTLPPRAQTVVDRHSPNGSAAQWFTSVEEGTDLLTHQAYRDLLIAADQSDHAVTNFHRGGAARPVFEVDLPTFSATVTIDHDECTIRYNLESDATVRISYDGDVITGWQFPGEVDITAAVDMVEGLAQELEASLEFTDTLLAAT